jgi:hypothetical protein
LADLRDVLKKNWLEGLSAYELKERLEALNAKDDEAGRAAIWLHHEAQMDVEKNRHSSHGMKVPKDE